MCIIKVMYSPSRLFSMVLIIITVFTAIIYTEESPLSPGDKIPNVLLLQSYHQGYKWSDELGRGVMEILQDEVQVHIEYMDTKKYYSPEYLMKIKNYLMFKSESIDFDLIIAADNNAFEFMKLYREEIYGDIPVVFTGVNSVNTDSLAGIHNITGISEEIDFQKTLELMRNLFPERKNLICILDQTATGLGIRKALDKAMPDFEKEFEQIEIWSDISMKELVRDLELLGDDFIIYNILFQRDNQDEYFEYNHSNGMIGNAANAPVFGAWDFQFPYGIVGGYIVSAIEQGREAGLMAKRILSGEDADSIPIIWETPHQYMFDFEKLLTNSIRMDELPRNSIVINLPETLFYQYHWETTIILITFIFLLILIFFLQANIQKRKAGEAALYSLNETLNEKVENRTRDLKISNQSLEDAMEKLQNTQKQMIQKERLAALGSLVTGVAHEVNTPLGVGITTSSYIIDLTSKLQSKLKNDTLTREALDEYIERINQGSSLLSKNLNKTAKLIDSFKNLSFDETGGECLDFELLEYLEEIIRTHIMQFNHQNIKISLSGDAINIRSYPGSFYHVMNNLLLNSLVHGYDEKSKNKKITITLTELEGQSGMIEYRDNGKGIPRDLKDHMFEPFTTSSRSEGKTGLGLFIIFKTVNEKLGGAVEFMPAEEGSDHEGVCFRIYFPINRPIDKG
ncbi:sensor histidine kinase [Oceanispirochaeta sp. M1]|uniref:sensor histidine kinase n=2 Tax=Oceanispirochaeta TaxID=2035349 RepID=UPI0014950B21|nr:sensor histidine kinase [Oceanispirochaeta sp. M1]